MAALASRVVGNASAAARAAAVGEHVAGTSRTQWVPPEPAAVSPAYHAAA